MTDQAKLQRLILESITDLRAHFSSLSDDDIAADIINVTCKYIIESKHFDYRTSQQPMTYFHHNWASCNSFVSEVIMSLRPNLNGIITDQTCQALTQNVCFNLGWSEMPTFLNNYFSEKHGRSQYEDEEMFDFMSVEHNRYHNSQLVSSSKVDRNISVKCWNNREDMSIEITPSLSLKRGRLEKILGKLYLYRGVDPDYLFEIKFNQFDEIEYVSVTLQSRGLKLSFY